MVKWAHMPVAIWNDAWYDILAIYSGSATLVDQDPVIIYAAVGKPPTAPYQVSLITPHLPRSCYISRQLIDRHLTLRDLLQFNYGLALPRNRSDPLLAEWFKPDYTAPPTIRPLHGKLQTRSGDSLGRIPSTRALISCHGDQLASTVYPSATTPAYFRCAWRARGDPSPQRNVQETGRVPSLVCPAQARDGVAQ
jgi:hypothetical protein